jgi:hypothetical protein
MVHHSRLMAFLPVSAAFLLLVFAAGVLATPAHAADDSNAGQLTQTPTVTPQQLNAALSALAGGSNDTQMRQLISQLQSQLAGGNYNGAASTLVQLQGLGKQGGLSPSLNALLQSLAVGSNGATIDAKTLASLLRASQGGTGASQQKLSVDMQTLANLMQYVNATMASQLLQDSQLLSQNAFVGGNGQSGGNAPIALPGLSTLPGVSMPPIGGPSLSVGGPSGGLPSIPLTTFAVPLIGAAMVAALFLFRGRVVRLIGTQSLPGMALLRRGRDEGDGGVVPSDPRRRIEYYFGRAVRLMGRRGVPKLDHETHREFSANCESKPERPQVGTISSLYEKAKFSGQEVGGPEADAAASAYNEMGKGEQ